MGRTYFCFTPFCYETECLDTYTGKIQMFGCSQFWVNFKANWQNTVLVEPAWFLPRCMECRCSLAMRILSVCPSVYPSFLRRRMVGGGRPLLREILGQQGAIGVKSSILNWYSHYHLFVWWPVLIIENTCILLTSVAIQGPVSLLGKHRCHLAILVHSTNICTKTHAWRSFGSFRMFTFNDLNSDVNFVNSDVLNTFVVNYL